jgi:hypothetical protein
LLQWIKFNLSGNKQVSRNPNHAIVVVLHETNSLKQASSFYHGALVGFSVYTPH